MGINDSEKDDDVSSQGNQSTLSLNLDTIGGSVNIPFDGHLQWILKYHLAMCSHMQKEYYQSQQVKCYRSYSFLIHSFQLLADCITSLRAYVPDGFALGSALFYHSIAEYYNTSSGLTPSQDTLAEITSTLTHCIEHLTECISLPWTKLSRKRKILCYLCRGKTYQRLKQYEKSIADLTYCIQLYQNGSAMKEPTDMEEGQPIHHDGEKEEGGDGVEDNEQDEDVDEADAAYAYFRRGWSYKVVPCFYASVIFHRPYKDTI